MGGVAEILDRGVEAEEGERQIMKGMGEKRRGGQEEESWKREKIESAKEKRGKEKKGKKLCMRVSAFFYVLRVCVWGGRYGV